METVSRYIDADILAELVEEEFDGLVVYDVPPDEAVADFCDIIDSCPTIDVAPVVHGRWIEPSLEKTNKMGLCGSGLCRCSVCRHEEPVFEEYPKYKYCPNCGAKMESEENNNE